MTKTFFCCTILKRDGYCMASGISPSQVSSQNRVSRPLPGTKDPLEKKSFLVAIMPFQNGESVGFGFTCSRVLPHRYLLLNSSCHTPNFSLFYKAICLVNICILYQVIQYLIHWSLGRHKIFHLVRWYFILF